MSIENKLKELGITLPNAPDPVGAYVAFKQINNLLFISGQLPISNDGKILKGKIGKNLNLADGQKASTRRHHYSSQNFWTDRIAFSRLR